LSAPTDNQIYALAANQFSPSPGTTLVSGTNLAVGPNALNIVTTGTGNTAIGNDSGGSPYGVSTGSGNVMVGANAGDICSGGSNNTFLGSNTDFTPRVGYYNGSIALVSGAIVDNYNQLMVAPNVTTFNIAGLAASRGTGAGTILEFDLAGNVLPTAGTYKTVASIDTAIATINAPNFFWFTDPSLSGATESIFNPIPWGTIVYGNPSNLDTTTGIWTCPAAGLWQFIFSIFYEGYLGDPGWNLYKNGKVVSLIKQASNSSQYITTVGPFITPAKAGDTFQWQFNFFNNTSPPVVVNGAGCFWQGLMIAPGYTAA